MTWLQLTICMLVIIAGGGVITILKGACVVVLNVLAYPRDARGDFVIRSESADKALYTGGVLIGFGVIVFAAGFLSLLANLGACQHTWRLIVSVHLQRKPYRETPLISPLQRNSVRYKRNPFSMIDCQIFKTVALSITLTGSLGMVLTGA